MPVHRRYSMCAAPVTCWLAPAGCLLVAECHVRRRIEKKRDKGGRRDGGSSASESDACPITALARIIPDASMIDATVHYKRQGILHLGY